MAFTMTEIARKLGVSQSTVSRVLNGKAEGRVSPDIRKSIEEAVLKYGFRPNLAAKSLRCKKTHAIGVLLPSTKDVFYADLVAQIQHVLSSTDYMAVFSFWEDEAGQKPVLQNIMSHGVDAIITVEPKLIPDWVDIPVVTYFNDDKRFDYMGFDYRSAAESSMEYLMGLGHRRIGYLGSGSDFRHAVFRETLGRMLLPEDDELVFTELAEGRSALQFGADGLEALFQNPNPPTAILAQSDVLAMGILHKAWEKGIRVPGHLSVIGFDNIPQSAYFIPPLTTFQHLTGKASAEKLIEFVFKRIKDPLRPRQVHIISPEMIVRCSCARLGALFVERGG